MTVPPVVVQGEVWWADLGQPVGSVPGYRRPVVIVQGGLLNGSRISTVICIPLTSNLDWEAIPTCLRLPAKATGLDRDSIAQASQILTADRSQLIEPIGQISERQLGQLLARLDVALGRGGDDYNFLRDVESSVMQSADMVSSDFGIGVYSVPEAARMIGMGGQTLRRWLLGYDHAASDGKHFHYPLWSLQHERLDDEIFLGFRDLVEARIVNALRQSGISLQAIRECLDVARQIINDAHPFSTKHFKTDGKSLFLEIAENASDPHLIDLKRRQHVFRNVVAPSLNGIEFGQEAAERWWLLDGKKTVVADPTRSFGQPIVASSGLTTRRIKEAVEAEGSIERAAKVYEIRQSEIRDALAYERLAAGAMLH